MNTGTTINAVFISKDYTMGLEQVYNARAWLLNGITWNTLFSVPSSSCLPQLHHTQTWLYTYMSRDYF